MRALALLLLVPSVALADAIAPGYHGVEYDFEVVNLDEHADYFFVVYPTTNAGFGYAMENDADLSELMINRRGLVSRLYAMPKDVLAQHDPDARRLAHARNGVETYVIGEPDTAPRTLVAEADIAPIGAIPREDPRIAVTRKFRVSRLDATHFELELVEEIAQNRDGTRVRVLADGSREELPAPEGWVPPPEEPDLETSLLEAARGREVQLAEEAESSGCGGCASERSEGGAFLALLVVISLGLRQRRQTGERT